LAFENFEKNLVTTVVFLVKTILKKKAKGMEEGSV
tara:strand:- start:1077 stop:1181 length:105 start_codon:yes stop_codon:yes gene_type:complete